MKRSQGIYISVVLRLMLIICCAGLVFLHYNNRGDSSQSVIEAEKSDVNSDTPSESKHITQLGINVVKSDLAGVRNYEKTYPPLINACYRGFLDVVKSELKNGADPNMRAFDGTVGLHYVCRNGNDTHSKDILDLLIEYGARADVRDTSGTTPLHLVTQIDIARVRNYMWEVLIKNGAKTNALTVAAESGVKPGKQNSRTYSVLEIFVNNYDRTGCVDSLVRWGWLMDERIRARARDYAYDLGFKNVDSGFMDLFDRYKKIADTYKNYDRVFDVTARRLLKEFSFSQGVAQKEGAADEYGSTSIKGGAPFATYRGLTPLMVAVLMGDIRSIKAILKDKNDGAQLNIPSADTYQRTALHLAIITQEVSAVEELLLAKPHLDRVDWQGNGPLHAVAGIGQIITQKKLTPLLVHAGCSFLAHNKSGDTPLHRAVRLNDQTYIEYLVQEYKDEIAQARAIKNKENLTPRGLAKKLYLIEIATLLKG